MWGKAGFFDIEEFEKIKDYSSYFQGFIDVTAGSLGQVIFLNNFYKMT